MSESHQEHDTVSAIQQLQDEYPFATALLIYCLIERRLKYFIYSETKKTQSKLKSSFLQPFKGKTDNELLEYLTDIYLRDIGKGFNSVSEKEEIVEIGRRSNGYMHSNFLISPAPSQNKEDRHMEHKEKLRQALKDLKNVFDIIEDDYEIAIDETKNTWEFRPR